MKFQIPTVCKCTHHLVSANKVYIRRYFRIVHAPYDIKLSENHNKCNKTVKQIHQTIGPYKFLLVKIISELPTLVIVQQATGNSPFETAQANRRSRQGLDAHKQHAINGLRR